MDDSVRRHVNRTRGGRYGAWAPAFSSPRNAFYKQVPLLAPQEAPATAELRTLARGLETPRLIHGVIEVSDLLDGTLDTEMERHLRAGNGAAAYDVATGFGGGEAAVGRLVERLRRDAARGEAAASRVRTLTRWVRPELLPPPLRTRGCAKNANENGMELSCVLLWGVERHGLGRTAADKTERAEWSD